MHKLFLYSKTTGVGFAGVTVPGIITRQQKEAVERLEDEADAMPDGFSADQGEIRADHLTRELTEVFVEKVIVWPGQKLEIKWKIRK